jgi:hypothetical protein
MMLKKISAPILCWAVLVFLAVFPPGLASLAAPAKLRILALYTDADVGRESLTASRLAALDAGSAGNSNGNGGGGAMAQILPETEIEIVPVPASTAAEGLAGVCAALGGSGGGIHAVLGPGRSTVGESVLPATARAGMLAVSASMTLPALGDPARYPFFARLVPGDDVGGTAIGEVVRALAPRRVALVYSGVGTYVTAANAFTVVARRAASRTQPRPEDLDLISSRQRLDAGELAALPDPGPFELAHTIMVPAVLDPAAIAAFLTRVDDDRIAYLVVISSREVSRQVVEAADALSMLERTVLVGGESFDATLTANAPGLASRLVGALAVVPEQLPSPESEAFLQRWAALDPAAWPGAGNSAVLSFFTLNSYDAVAAIARAVRAAVDAGATTVGPYSYSGICDTHPGAATARSTAASAFPRAAPVPQASGAALHTAMLRLAFRGVSGPVAFDAAGDRVPSYTVSNFQQHGAAAFTGSTAVVHRFEPVGTWSATRGVELAEPRVQWPGNRTSRPVDVAGETRDTVLVVGTIAAPPFVLDAAGGALDSTEQNFTGYLVEYLHEIAREVGFSFRFETLPPGATVADLVDSIAEEPGDGEDPLSSRADDASTRNADGADGADAADATAAAPRYPRPHWDLVLAGVPLRPDLQPRVALTPPLIVSNYRLLVAFEGDVLGIWAFGAPFSAGVWLLLIFTIAVTSVAYWLVERGHSLSGKSCSALGVFFCILFSFFYIKKNSSKAIHPSIHPYDTPKQPMLPMRPS